MQSTYSGFLDRLDCVKVDALANPPQALRVRHGACVGILRAPLTETPNGVAYVTRTFSNDPKRRGCRWGA